MKQFIFFLLALAALGCTKETEVVKYVDKVYSWTEDSYFSHYYVTLDNSYSSGDCLFVSGTKLFTEIKLENGSLSHESCYSPSHEISSRTSIGEKYFSRPPNQLGKYIEIYMNDWNQYRGYYTFDMEAIDSSFRFFSSPAYYLYPMSCIMGDYIMIPYNDSWGHLKALLCKMKYLSTYSEEHLDIESMKILMLDDFPSTTLLTTINTDGNAFFITTSKTKLLIVDTKGNVNSFPRCEATGFVKVSDRLSYLLSDYCAIRIENSSTPILMAFESNLEHGMNYSCIAGKVVAYRYSQMWETTIQNGRIDFRELKNDGIAGNLITSINQLGDSLVYATTLSGGFYKPLDKFFADTVK